MLLLFTFGVQLLATEKNVWSTIAYNPPIIVYWQVREPFKNVLAVFAL